MKTPVLPQASSLFVYGTLMAPEVIQLLIGRAPPGRSARLLGNYVRHPVHRHVFPGLIRAAIDEPTVKGILYSDLTGSEMKRLDWFEGEEYTKQQCTVELEDDVEPCEAVVYLWTNPVSELDVTKQWFYENFREKHLKDYLKDTVRPCRDELDRGIKG
jgi:gamma-glutamylcyclotransferase (GGCT)/AIG2-like uncharacterized protein YtfP